MAAKPKQEMLTPAEQIAAFLKANKEDHYNFEPTINYKVPSSSLIFNSFINGGISPGALRFTGVTGGGKTSCVLDFMKNFLNGGNDRYGIYIKSEGRLSENMRERSGVDFVECQMEAIPDFVPGKCFVFESNVYEAVFGLIGTLIKNNPTKAKYFFVIDSMDMLGKRDDLAKPLEEAGQVAGGALLTSVFLKKTSVALAKRGHLIAFLSQVRDEIKLNPYAGGGTTPRQGKSSGGHALEHAPDWVFDFQPRYGDDIIRVSDDKNAEILGHYCKIKLFKTDNEKNLQEIRYPIRYQRKNGQSVWREKEVADLLLTWGKLTKKGAWYYISEDIRLEILDIDPEVPESFQGFEAVNKYLQSHDEVVTYLFDKFQKILM